MAADVVIPVWAAPTDIEVEDAHHIAHSVAADPDDRSPVDVIRWRARAAAFDWVMGVFDPMTDAPVAAPVTGRTDVPLEAVVRGEMICADCVVVGVPMASEMWRRLEVAERAPLTNDRGWCDAVAGVLGWLLGSRSAPIRVPRRNPDGTVMTSAQLYAEKAAARRILPPEDRARLRTEADVEADVYRRLALLVDASRAPLTRT